MTQQWTEDQLFEGLTGEQFVGRITKTEKRRDSGDSGYVIFVEHTTDESPVTGNAGTKFYAFLYAEQSMLAIYAPMATDLPADRYGLVMDFMNAKSNDCGHTCVPKAHVEPPEPGAKTLRVGFSWEMPLFGDNLMSLEALPALRDLISSVVLNMYADALNLLHSAYEENDQMAMA